VAAWAREVDGTTLALGQCVLDNAFVSIFVSSVMGAHPLIGSSTIWVSSAPWVHLVHHRVVKHGVFNGSLVLRVQQSVKVTSEANMGIEMDLELRI